MHSHQVTVSKKQRNTRSGLTPAQPLVYAKQMSEQLLETVWKTTVSASISKTRIIARDLVTEVQHLLKSGADPNAVNTHGQTCLHLIVRCNIEGSNEIVDLLLSSGASPNIANVYENTPLLLATMSGKDAQNQGMIERLVAAGADVNKADMHGQTSLHHVVIRGRFEIVRILLLAGAEPDPIDHCKNTPLLLAMEKKSISCEQRFGVAQQLVTAGANVNARHPSSRTTCLHFACLYGDLESVDLLLSRGASFSVVDRDGNNALLYGTMSGNVKVVQKLIDAGCDMNYVNQDGTFRGFTGPITALHVAIEKNSVEMLELFLKRGANPNQLTNLDDSLLSLAAYANHEDAHSMFKLLLCYGADMYVTGEEEYDFLLELIVTLDKVTLTRLLLAHGLDLSRYDPRTPYDFSPLHTSIGNESKNMLSVLLKYDTKGSLDLEHENEDGVTPLGLAVMENLPDCVELLLDAGANVNHIDWKGRTPLEIAASAETYLYPVCKLVIENLMKAGAKLRNVLSELMDAGKQGDQCMEYIDSFAKLIVKWRVLYESGKSSVADPLEHDIMDGSDELRNYYEVCKSEILFLKSLSLHGSITYCDLLATGKEFYKRVRDDKVYEAFDAKKFTQRCRVYDKDLCKRVSSVKTAHYTWEQSVQKLSQYLRFDPDTYYLAIRNILDRLDEDELRLLADS